MTSTYFDSSQAWSPRGISTPTLQRAADVWTTTARHCAWVGLLLTAGCAAIEHTTQPSASPTTAPPAITVSVEPPPTTPTPPAPPTQAKAAQHSSATNGSTPRRPEPSSPSAQRDVNVAATPRARSETSTGVPAKGPSAAPLDLKSLETRLKETPAIGVFTKLALKNQIDELLDRFRGFYQGKVKTSLAELRRSYDLLVLKVLALLQEADPPLASAIAGSREAIWGVLSNPAKFAAV
jgi:hypothetical protein